MANVRYFVISRLTSSMRYNLFEQRGDKPALKDSVFVKGGAGIARGKNLETDFAEGTEITEQQVALLKQDPTFKLHEKNGFVTIQVRKDVPDVEKEASNLSGDNDGSAPLNPASIEKLAEQDGAGAAKLLDSNKEEKAKGGTTKASGDAE